MQQKFRAVDEQGLLKIAANNGLAKLRAEDRLKGVLTEVPHSKHVQRCQVSPGAGPPGLPEGDQ